MVLVATSSLPLGRLAAALVEMFPFMLVLLRLLGVLVAMSFLKAGAARMVPVAQCALQRQRLIQVEL